MARTVASQWVASGLKDEYRINVYGCGTRTETRHLAALLRSFRDGKTRVAGVEPVLDLGVVEHGDHLEIWSSDGVRLGKLASWLEGRGMDTSFIW